MEHCIKFCGKPITIGIDTHLCFATVEQLYRAWNKNLLKGLPEHFPPIQFISGNSGFIFRFPFPDEAIPLGEYPETISKRGLLMEIEKYQILKDEDFNKIAITFISETQPTLKSEFQCDNPNSLQSKIQIELIGQQLLFDGHQYKLCPVLRCPYSGQTFLIKGENELNVLMTEILLRYGMDEFWKEIISELGKGISTDFNTEL